MMIKAENIFSQIFILFRSCYYSNFYEHHFIYFSYNVQVEVCSCITVNESVFVPVAPDWLMMADMGIVLMMVVPCLVAGETPLMLRIVGLFPAPPAWEVVMMVVGLPSAEVTSFRMVPAGSGPFVWGERHTSSKLSGESHLVPVSGVLWQLLCFSCTHEDSWPVWAVREG